MSKGNRMVVERPKATATCLLTELTVLIVDCAGQYLTFLLQKVHSKIVFSELG